MLVLHADPLFEEHITPGHHPERPERSRKVAEALGALEGVRRAEVDAAPGGALEDVARVHDPGYARAVAALAARGGGALDADTFVSPRSYEVALAAVGAVSSAVDTACQAAPGAVEARAFAVVRPPGHHARPATGMGFCLFNNVAVAAARARAVHGLSRVAIVDFDVHHGNGTQEIFWEEPQVFFVSTHGAGFYPGSGSADEAGAGAARGTKLNLPLPPSVGSAGYRAAFRRGVDAVRAFRPELVLVSAGFDAWKRDPLGDLGLDAGDYRWIGEELGAIAREHAQGRVVAALEGGYDLGAVGRLAAAFAQGLCAGAEG